ncbi:MAG: hypothetical protein J6U54_04945 [Clostridiales bacterium]|nr:hypothetical protein [Clostridiales bacterium]
MEVLRNGTRVIGIFKCPVCLCEFRVHIKECLLSPACLGSRIAYYNCPTCDTTLAKSVTDFKEDGDD